MRRRLTSRTWMLGMVVVLLAVVLATRTTYGKQVKKQRPADIFANAIEKITRGREIFRFDTFGDEAFWGGTLRLHEAIEGVAFGGVGPGLTPRAALAHGLKSTSTPCRVLWSRKSSAAT